MTETYAKPERDEWYPLGCHRDHGGDYHPMPKSWQRRLCLSDRVVEIFNDEIAHLHVKIWEGADDDGNAWIELLMFGADGYASKIKLPDFIETAFLPVGHMRGWGKRDKIKALQDLQTRVATIIEKLDSAQ